MTFILGALIITAAATFALWLNDKLPAQDLPDDLDNKENSHD